LSAYEDLIEKNRKRILLLDEAACILYNEWFMRLRFPDHKRNRIVDGLPNGWERKTIGEVAQTITRGLTPQYDDYADNIVISQKCIRDTKLSLELARTQKKEVPPHKLVQLGDILINSTGEGTLGRVAQVRREITNCTVDSHVTIVRPPQGQGKWFLGFAVSQLQPILMVLGRGATNQTELSKDTIAEMKILLPDDNLVNKFEKIVEPIINQSENLAVQNILAREARDILLPKLMSGEIEV
jgi:type I restriction enzyme S subunit